MTKQKQPQGPSPAAQDDKIKKQAWPESPRHHGRGISHPIICRFVMQRYLCIHAHFYQPPRENPWLEAVELQDSAYPFHDWNQRITAECYAPNSASRILDAEGRIEQIVNNYSKISFNFGPTLLDWMEKQRPDTYRAILEADAQSRERFSGHGSAIAQAYNHMILPLATRRDKQTQVIWGMRNFERHFRRRPEGMWLPETAVDIESLETLAEQGILFTILAPRQANRVRSLNGRKWKDIRGGRIDPSRAYLCRLPSGKSINLFFYDGPISQAVAFEGLLENGERFAEKLLSGFSHGRDWPQLMHIATDGESYGHHHAHGDMALAYALHHVESNNLALITNYGEFLEKHPATHEVEIAEGSSWSCSHGLERWRSDCGCNTGRAGWKQAWRGPLRQALDYLRDQLAGQYEERAQRLFRDPWAARDAYIKVLLDRSPQSIKEFLAEHALPGRHKDPVLPLKLLEMQRHLLLMYTSCGWYFDEISGLESTQVLQYAGRALQLAQEIFGPADLEERFRQILAQAPSNLPEQKNGAYIYETLVKPAAIDLRRVGAHAAIRYMFGPKERHSRVFSYEVRLGEHKNFESGAAQLALGELEVSSRVTLESAHLAFGVAHFGDHRVHARVRHVEPGAGNEVSQLAVEIGEPFRFGDLPEVIQALDAQFPEPTYTLQSLFRDEKRIIVKSILESTLRQSEESYREIFERDAPLMSFVSEVGVPQPEVFRVTASFVLNSQLREALSAPEPDVVTIMSLLESARQAKVELDARTLEHSFRSGLGRMMQGLEEDLRDPAQSLPRLQKLVAALELTTTLPFPVNLWRMQNDYYRLRAETRDPSRMPAWLRNGVPEAGRWREQFRLLGEKLKVRVDDLAPETSEMPGQAA